MTTKQITVLTKNNESIDSNIPTFFSTLSQNTSITIWLKVMIFFSNWINQIQIKYCQSVRNTYNCITVETIPLPPLFTDVRTSAPKPAKTEPPCLTFPTNNPNIFNCSVTTTWVSSFFRLQLFLFQLYSQFATIKSNFLRQFSRLVTFFPYNVFPSLSFSKNRKG